MATPVVVQTKGVQANNITAVSATFTTPPSSGNKIVAVLATTGNGGTVYTAPDGTWVSHALNNYTGRALQIFAKNAGGSEPSTVTFTASLSGTHAIVLYEISNLLGTSIDTSVTSDDAGATTTSLATGTTGALAQADEIIIAACMQAGANGATEAATNSFTIREAANLDILIVADKIVSATTSQSTTFSWTNARRASTAMISLKAAGSTGVTADAGANQTAVEPLTTVTLTGTPGGGDGTYTQTWTQPGGTPVVTLAGSGASRTFTAPGTYTGTTLTFTYTVDDGVAAPVTDTMTVAVLQHNEYVLNAAGVWLPYKQSTL